MIVCHCTKITDTEIHAAIDWMRVSDPRAVITPGKIYHALGKSADCGGCMPLFLDTMRASDNLEVPMQLCALRTKASQESVDEGRSQSHRIPQQISAA
ncbi:(2Fe-2S)-binding protein [Ruegeria faecimaris]|uniref:BFD-like [2Fe-2S] binding domain-containing protein n=1 Tax=Ruegeria faecimaris TaxID=686389 RepID=A0A521CDF3_9RHOB|nr:(2Fe-2S)-binding protein [Ruegeria faecimaris]SMO57457.1 BFD-like [2Fe-2S] binding domain-containing protein [Ruegeria faecimaris]